MGFLLTVSTPSSLYNIPLYLINICFSEVYIVQNYLSSFHLIGINMDLFLYSFNLSVCSYLKWTSCRQHIPGNFFKCWYFLKQSLSFNWCICAIHILVNYWYNHISIYHVCSSFLSSLLCFLSPPFTVLCDFNWTFYIILFSLLL